MEKASVSIPKELHTKLEQHAKQKRIPVDQEATELLGLSVHLIEMLMAAKNIMKNGDIEL